MVTRKRTKSGIAGRVKQTRKGRSRRKPPLAGKKESSRPEKFEGNPILKPKEEHSWESKAAFNPGAIYENGKVHLLYRAIGDKEVSVLGYASSRDGLNIEERLSYPVYTKKGKGEEHFSEFLPSPIFYCSGGGWNGGCEDPRLTLIGDTAYLLYTAFDGWGSLRIALTSIGLEDFRNKKWNWKNPVLISPPGEIHKNWVIFPEKINGKYAILHSISPKILVDYFDSLEEFDGNKYLKSYHSGKLNKKRWDSWTRGAGPPPIKTKEGWLLLYHAIARREPGKYKLGAMLLDLKDPTKVLYRSKEPILEPTEPYENEGFKAGVIYSCGAVVADGILFIYYGGADSVTCVATANLENFLEELKKTGSPKLKKTATLAGK